MYTLKHSSEQTTTDPQTTLFGISLTTTNSYVGTNTPMYEPPRRTEQKGTDKGDWTKGTGREGRDERDWMRGSASLSCLCRTKESFAIPGRRKGHPRKVSSPVSVTYT